MSDDLLNAGKHRALYAAIEALVKAAPNRDAAVTTALHAIEAEIARELYMPARPQAWIDGLLDAQQEIREYYRGSDT